MIDLVEKERRIQIYRRVAPFFGKVQPAALLRDAEQFGHILHHFAEGIFKPQWATYALSITSMLSSQYSDEIQYLPDRSWTMAYSPKAGTLESAANRALILCLDDKEPVLILRQTSAKIAKAVRVILSLALGSSSASIRQVSCSGSGVCMLKKLAGICTEMNSYQMICWTLR